MIDAVSALSVGLVRTLNEDGVHVGRRLIAVADGMGGHAAGDRARDLVLEAMATLDRDDVTAVDVQAAILTANDMILEHARLHPEAEGMGTTVCGALVLTGVGEDLWLVFNVGDSRVYVWDDHELRQVTTDHSEVQEMVDAGQLTKEQARMAPNRNVITRAVGQQPPPQVDFFTVPAGTGEVLLLTSDGLTSEVDDDVIVGVLSGHRAMGDAAQGLVAAAEAAGGHDNISVILGRWTDGAHSDGPPTDEDQARRTRSTTVPRDLVAREVLQ